MSFVELNFYSDTLQMKVDVNVVVPNCEPGKKTKVLWLYHGGYGDHNDWVHNTNVVRMAEERGIAVVMPGEWTCIWHLRRCGIANGIKIDVYCFLSRAYR